MIMDRKREETNIFQNSPRQCMTICLIIGDLFGAIFCIGYTNLVVSYKTIEDINWCDFRYMGLYLFYYMPFVYSFALATLCVELKWRRKIMATFKSPLNASFCMTALPWLLGIVTMSPLLYVEFDTDECPNFNTLEKYRDKVFYVIALVIPSTLVFVVVVIVNSMDIEDISEYYSLVSVNRSAEQKTPPPPYSEMHSSSPSVYYPNAKISNAMEDKHSSTQPTFHKSFLSQDSKGLTSLDISPCTIKFEQQALIVVSCVNLLLTVPFGIFVVYHLFGGDIEQTNHATDAIIMLMIEWMVPLRSLVTPLVWWNSLLNGRKGFNSMKETILFSWEDLRTFSRFLHQFRIGQPNELHL